MHHQLKTAVPALLGAAVCIALGNVLSTVLFNATAWLVMGNGVSIADAYTRLSSSPLFVFFSFSAQAAACAMGGFTAAAHSTHRPYFNALYAAALLIAWYLVMYLTPLAIVPVNSTLLFIELVPPFPMAIFGASIWLRAFGTRR